MSLRISQTATVSHSPFANEVKSKAEFEGYLCHRVVALAIKLVAYSLSLKDAEVPIRCLYPLLGSRSAVALM